MLTRTLSWQLVKVCKQYPVVFVTGPRKVGKTTLLKYFASSKYHFVSLNDLNERQLALTDPVLFLKNHEPPLIIDECQYAPILFSHIQSYLNDHQGVNGLFVLSSSIKFSKTELKKSMSCEVAILELQGLSLGEFKSKPFSDPFLPGTHYLKINNSCHDYDFKSLYRDIFYGLNLRMVAKNAEDSARHQFYNSLLQDFLCKDILYQTSIGDGVAFMSFLQQVASSTDKLLNLKKLAQASNIDLKTAKLWLNLLQKFGMVYLLPPYLKYSSSSKSKSPKIYFLDTGLCCYLAKISNADHLQICTMNKAILKTFVLAEILKSYWYNFKEPKLYYYQGNGGIDFVLEADEILFPIEVNMSGIQKIKHYQDFDILKFLGKKVGTGVVLCGRKDVAYLKEDVISAPVWSITLN